MRARDLLEILGAVGMTVALYVGLRLIFDAVLDLVAGKDPRA